MSEAASARIGFLGSSVSSSPHLKKFQAFIPKDIEMTFEGLGLQGASMYDFEGKIDSLVRNTIDLVDKYKWDGVIFPGAPREVLNPGLFSRLSSSLKIPAVTALRSSIAALRTFSVKRVLLMTPFDQPLNKLIRDFLAEARIEAVSASSTFRHPTEARKLTSSDVESMTKKELAANQGVDAVYFQGAVLDPVEILEKMETELEIPIVASNPAMLWFILSKLGLRYQIRGYGKLLSSWPAIPAN
jgi:Arylmalonate decarboxylase